MMENKKIGLELLREPFNKNQISKLPKPTKAQNSCDKNQKRHCDICGGFHHPDVIHLDYVGHAALTDRLLDADPLWTWEPFAINESGLPAFDSTGGLWIKLTVCGHTRIGYGHAEESQYKEIGSREKEVIGDALRNAAMRFGAALDLWHKGTLHIDDDVAPEKPTNAPQATKSEMVKATTADLLKAVKAKLGKKMKGMSNEEKAAFYKFCIGGKKETVDAVQDIIDRYDDYYKPYQEMLEATNDVDD